MRFLFTLWKCEVLHNLSLKFLSFFQKYNLFNPQHSSFNTEVELNEIRDTIQQLLRWGWKYNKNLEEQAAQLHMLTGWSQIVEVTFLLLVLGSQFVGMLCCMRVCWANSPVVQFFF